MCVLDLYLLVSVFESSEIYFPGYDRMMLKKTLHRTRMTAMNDVKCKLVNDTNENFGLNGLYRDDMILIDLQVG